MPSHRLRIAVAPPFELGLCLTGHGWVALAPHRFDADPGRLTTALRIAGMPIDASLTQTTPTTLALQLTSPRKLTRAELDTARRQIVHMLRLDDDLSQFHALCRDEPRLRWVVRRGGGRLMRSATVFEDLMKLLFTTNTSWAATESMTRNLVTAIGPRTEQGVCAFPTATECVRDTTFYRDVVRCGYRAESAVRLARAFADGHLSDDDFLAPQPSDQLWQRLCGLHGFGPYAAGQAMRLCGHYDRLAIDSWCRARLAALAGRSRPPADGTIARRYQRFAPFQGLAMWCELTAQWHGES